MNLAIAFDVNETLLDLRALDPTFERFFGDAAARGDWFRLLLTLSQQVTILDAYQDFSALGRAALAMVAAARGASADARMTEELAAALRAVPLHADVLPALDRLRAAGCRLAALTNSAPAMVEAQLGTTGIIDRFEHVLSVDAVRAFKPHPAPYRLAAERFGIPIGELWMVAAHAWDCWGAMRAGARAAFVERKGALRLPIAPAPTVIAGDLPGAAEAMLALGS